MRLPPGERCQGKARVFGFALLCLCFLSASALAAEGTDSARSVVLVLIDTLSLADIDAELTPNIRHLSSEGAIGLMNARTARTLQPEHAYVTLGAGTRAQGPPETAHGFNRDEHAQGQEGAVVYARNTGRPIPPAGSVVHPYVALIARANAGAHYQIVPGALGEALLQAGKSAAVFGNSDSSGHLGRYAVTVAMDRWGVVGLGDVGPSMVIDLPDFPGGMVSDIARIVSKLSEVTRAEMADFVVVESGDLARVERCWQAGVLTSEAYRMARRRALASADELVGSLAEALDLSKSILMIVSPAPASADVETGHCLALAIVAGKGFSPGLLTSATTRRWGLVANTDVAATIIEALGAEVPPWILGTPMHSSPGASMLLRLVSLHDAIARTSLIRVPLLKTFAGFLIAAAITSPVLIWISSARLGGASWGRQILSRDGWFRRVARGLMASLGAVPLAWLILPLVRPPGIVSAAAYTVALALCICVLAGLARGGLTRPLMIICLATGLGIIADALLGAKLMGSSVLGYDPVGGARFFGIGNEYMGALVGSLIVGSGLLLDSLGSADRALKRAAASGIALVFLAAFLALASPNIGANLGGAFTAAAGFGIACRLFAGRRISLRMILAIAALALLLVVGNALRDALRPGGPASHWGRTFLSVRSIGLAVAWDALRRKAEMSMKLLRYTIWTRAFLVFLAALVFLGVRPLGLARRILGAHPGFAAALTASLFAAGVALITNDSGIVSAAMITMYPSLVLLHLAWDDDFEPLQDT